MTSGPADDPVLVDGSLVVSGGHPDNDDRPWERPGAVRRDCEPHRAGLLQALGNVGLVFSAAGLVAALCLCALPLVAVVILLPCSLLGVPCGLTARALARRDLLMMRAGLMDRAGIGRTERALSAARLGLALS